MDATVLQAYAEVDMFIHMLGEEYLNKIPVKLRNFFADNKDRNYEAKIVPNIPIKGQKLKDETLAIIAFLNLKYWCIDQEERERLITVYKKNENMI